MTAPDPIPIHPTLSEDDYLEQRVEDQLKWYSAKSTTNKNHYYRLQIFALIAAALIPVIILSNDSGYARIAVAIIGALTAVVSGVLSLYQYREQWMDYRTTAESLKREKFLFLCKAAPYNNTQAFSLFVNNVESIIIDENKGWRNRQLTPDTESSEKTGGSEVTKTDSQVHTPDQA